MNYNHGPSGSHFGPPQDGFSHPFYPSDSTQPARNGYYGSNAMQMDVDRSSFDHCPQQQQPPPRRTVSFCGVEPQFMPQHHSSQLQHSSQKAPPSSHGMCVDSGNGSANYMDSNLDVDQNQHQPPPTPSFDGDSYGFDSRTGANGHYQLGVPTPSQQHQMRKMSHCGAFPQHASQPQPSSHFMHSHDALVNGYRHYETQEMGQPEQAHLANYHHRTTSVAGLPEASSMNWRKMSLAPNILMNSTPLSAERVVSPKRTQSQAAEYQKRKLSLYRFSSQLRHPRVTGVATPMLSLTPYTPPPMLSPVRNGLGLFCSISRKSSEFRKKSARLDMATDVIMEENSPSSSSAPPNHDSGIGEDMDQGGPSPCDAEDCLPAYPPATATTGNAAPAAPIKPPIDNRVNRPQRKNGLFLGGQQTNSTGFAAELEALRKASAESAASGKSIEAVRNSVQRKCSMRASTSGDEIIRKISDETAALRKASTVSEAYYDYTPCESDATPHINLGKVYQARVKKWVDREIMPHEREAIPDRDELIFDCGIIDHLDEQSVAAYEALACSAAVPKVGRNKELALHILMENKGNIQAAVMDLLRSDTLDWEQYPIIYNHRYSDVENWTPEEVSMFQDAIYKSEKDFHQVASELNRTVKDCVEFYYMWKKACPDDYRKLRNLRRKRQLLEQQLGFSSVNTQAKTTPPEESSEEDMMSESESDLGTPAYSERSPDESRAAKIARMNRSNSPVPPERKTSIRFNEPDKRPESNNGLNLYPWLHGENGVFPSPSPTNSSGPGNGHFSRPPSVGTDASMFSGDRFSLDLMQTKIANVQRVNASKKGAQPSADGFFHCRLCDKRFEKVKSLNAHMKSHAMKARAEAEAQAQIQQQQSKPPSVPSNSQQGSSDPVRNLALLHQQRQHHNGLLNQAQIEALGLQQQLNAVSGGAAAANGQSPNAASPLNLGQHLSRMTQFASPIGLGGGAGLGAGMNMFSPDMLMHLTNLPHSQHGSLATSVATTASALQQLHNNLQQHSATIIN